MAAKKGASRKRVKSVRIDDSTRAVEALAATRVPSDSAPIRTLIRTAERAAASQTRLACEAHWLCDNLGMTWEQAQDCLTEHVKAEVLIERWTAILAFRSELARRLDAQRGDLSQQYPLVGGSSARRLASPEALHLAREKRRLDQDIAGPPAHFRKELKRINALHDAWSGLNPQSIRSTVSARRSSNLPLLTSLAFEAVLPLMQHLSKHARSKRSKLSGTRVPAALGCNKGDRVPKDVRHAASALRLLQLESMTNPPMPKPPHEPGYTLTAMFWQPSTEERDAWEVSQLLRAVAREGTSVSPGPLRVLTGKGARRGARHATEQVLWDVCQVSPGTVRQRLKAVSRDE